MAVTTRSFCFPSFCGILSFPKTRRILQSNVDESSWADLPDDLVTCIGSRLSSKDYVRFAATCRTWWSFPHPRSRPMCLMLFRGCDGNCVIVDPFYMKIHRKLSFPELAGARVLSTRAGWLLLFKDNALFFFCPSTRELRSLPHAGQLERFRASFSSPPISSDCTVVLFISNYENIVLSWRPGECNWSVVHLYRFFSMRARFCGCCIYEWQHDFQKRLNVMMGDLINVACICWRLPENLLCSSLCVMEFEEEYYIILRTLGGTFRVFKTRRYLPGSVEEIHCLGERAIFFGNDGEARMVTAREMGMANKIYYPAHCSSHRFYCYSLGTKRYSCSPWFESWDPLPQSLVERYSSGDASSFWFEADGK